MTRRSCVRSLLAAMSALLAVALIAPEVWSQRPGSRPFPTTPGAPRPPTFRPPTIPAIPAPPVIPPPVIRPPGMLGGGVVTVWSCSGCRTELGRGPIPPSIGTCPHCGARLINGGGFASGPSGAGAGAAPQSIPPAVAPPSNPAVVEDPPLVPRSAPLPLDPAVPVAFQGAQNGSNPPLVAPDAPAAADGGNARGWLVLKVLALFFVGLFVLMVVCGVVIFVKANRGPTRRTRRGRRDRDDDWDD